ncbi:MAG: hypothetical protein ACMUIU_06460 [bacterium]
MKQALKIDEPSPLQIEIKKEIERTNAKLRHYRGVAVSVLNDALKIWLQILEDCRDTRTCEEIIDGIDETNIHLPLCGWQEFRERLRLLGHYIDYTKRLCEGSIEKTPNKESEG